MPVEVETIVAAYKIPASATNDVEELLEPLTPREQEVLRMLALGLANKENRRPAEDLRTHRLNSTWPQF